MPGSSLWLLPPADHPLDSLLTSLIEQTSAHFHSPHLFIPHVTLTSEIASSAYESNPQQWLDEFKFPKSDLVQVRFESLQSEDVFVRKLYIKVEKGGVIELGKVARQAVDGYVEEAAAKRWAEEKYAPHLSLLYHACPKVPEAEIAKIGGLLQAAGIDLEGQGELGGWEGGRVVLVPTDRPIAEWSPIAERTL
ncbi:2',3'-cyclic-nucleotide 3'-phosphodiesterase [Lophiostoma macrostomum CBS 122681]|uniref:2',3'-cyclic-nucleotide 3'-phosphodiesterase n=1 Tax=Lophiostoma macrostomum CBS 122681 TaxID=1314788 RepID=A0A6A6TRV8_9PLEO|nr:2',3'-cyclic-nucleotide 3'-phosphodiesterase [Lophiostoma macrostomum CBS 122681]